MIIQSCKTDVDNDGDVDIVGGGDIYETEPETSRYDASKGYVLLNDGKGSFRNSNNSGFYLDGNNKDLQLLTIGSNEVLVAFQNVGPVQSYRITAK